MPIAKEQGRLVADHLAGRYALPSASDMQAQINEADAAVRSRYVGSKRHTIQVDFEVYLHELRQERQRGVKRALDGRRSVPLPT